MNICWARYLMIAVVCVLGTTAMLSACGQKGPLFLPKEKKQQKATPAKTPAKTKSTDESKKDDEKAK